MWETAKKWGVILGLIGGLMSMGGVIGGFAQIVLHWEHFKYMSETINKTDVRHYNEVIKPHVEKLWELEQAEH